MITDNELRRIFQGAAYQPGARTIDGLRAVYDAGVSATRLADAEKALAEADAKLLATIERTREALAEGIAADERREAHKRRALLAIPIIAHILLGLACAALAIFCGWAVAVAWTTDQPGAAVLLAIMSIFSGALTVMNFTETRRYWLMRPEVPDAP